MRRLDENVHRISGYSLMELDRSYRVLGVPSDATVPEIRNAFRKLALEYHPDRNKSPEAAKLFAAITEAYDTIMSSAIFDNVAKNIHDNEDGLDLERGNLAFAILTEKERVYHVSPALFEDEIRKYFHPGLATGTFCKVGKRWFEIAEANTSFFHFGKHDGLVEWYKSPDRKDVRRPATWNDFWSYVRRYATQNVPLQKSTQTHS